MVPRWIAAPLRPPAAVVCVEHAFEEVSAAPRNANAVTNKDRPGPAFIALRAAALAIDDLSRQALRAWASDGLDFRGHPVPAHPAPDEPATAVIAAGVLILAAEERAAFRQWLGHWTDYAGRIITPQEHERRQEQLRREYEARPAPAPGRVPRGPCR